jgi:hypothetical protein
LIYREAWNRNIKQEGNVMQKGEATEEGCRRNGGRDGERNSLILSFVGILAKLG